MGLQRVAVRLLEWGISGTGLSSRHDGLARLRGGLQWQLGWLLAGIRRVRKQHAARRPCRCMCALWHSSARHIELLC